MLGENLKYQITKLSTQFYFCGLIAICNRIIDQVYRKVTNIVYYQFSFAIDCENRAYIRPTTGQLFTGQLDKKENPSAGYML